MIKYGTPPDVIGPIETGCKEMMFYQYLPVKMGLNNDRNYYDVRVPERLQWCLPIIAGCDWLYDDYVYLTAKCLYVTPENMGNRGGWHSDGFQTDDINYIWYDSFPTEFAIQDFDIPDDCEKSLIEMNRQVDYLSTKTYPTKTLIKLTQGNIHRVAVQEEEGFRQFIKISVSKNRYNLEGNSHNYLFDYDWPMEPRFTERNHPCRDYEGPIAKKG